MALVKALLSQISDPRETEWHRTLHVPWAASSPAHRCRLWVREPRTSKRSRGGARLRGGSGGGPRVAGSQAVQGVTTPRRQLPSFPQRLWGPRPLEPCWLQQGMGLKTWVWLPSGPNPQRTLGGPQTGSGLGFLGSTWEQEHLSHLLPDLLQHTGQAYEESGPSSKHKLSQNSRMTSREQPQGQPQTDHRNSPSFHVVVHQMGLLARVSGSHPGP